MVGRIVGRCSVGGEFVGRWSVIGVFVGRVVGGFPGQWLMVGRVVGVCASRLLVGGRSIFRSVVGIRWSVVLLYAFIYRILILSFFSTNFGFRIS